MKSSLASVLISRTTRVVALLLSVSAVALGGFFISQAYAQAAPDSYIKIATPTAGVFWRGTQTISWTASTTASTLNVLYSSNPNSFLSNIAPPNVPVSQKSTEWNTTGITNGTYYVRVLDTIDEIDTSSAFVLDNTAPVTTLASSSSDTNGWYNTTSGAPSITLTCDDSSTGGSGCSEIDYAWYNATTHAFSAGTTATTTVSGGTAHVTAPQGDNILVYSSQDNAVDKYGVHNIEDAHTAEFKVDTVAPTILSYTLNGKSADAYFNPANASTTIALTASEPVTWTTVEVKPKSGAGYVLWHPGNVGLTGTTTWNGTLSDDSGAPDGVYQVYYTIKDVAGNVTGSPAGPLTSHNIIVDSTKPSVTLSAPIADAVYKGTTGSDTTLDTSALSFTSSDTNPLIYTYSIDGKATTTPAMAPNDGSVLNAAITGLSDGRHTIVVTVTDDAGNSESSSPVSFVFDNNDTLTVGTVPAQDFGTIGDAVKAATSGDIIDIFPGAYAEDVTLGKALTLQSHSGPSGTTVHGLMTVAANNTTVKNLSFTNPDASTALLISGASNVSVTDNYFDTIGTTLDAGSAQAIDVNGGSSSTMSGITISDNHITNVGSANLAYSGVSGSGTSAKGIYIGDSTGTNTISGVTISGNHISNITASPTPWVRNGADTAWVSSVGRGAYGVLVNHATSGAGETSGLKITTNTISGLDGLWAHAIGLEGNTPGAQVTGNIISDLTDHKGGTDDIGVLLEDNTGASSVSIATNQFAQNIIGVANTTSATTTATGNWWSSVEGPTALWGNPFGDGAFVSPLVSFVPWCTDSSCTPLDMTAPTAIVTNAPANPTNDNNPSFIVGSTGSDAAVYYKYQLDGGAWSDETSISTAIAASSLADGSHTLNVLGRDQAGNWQTSPTTYIWTVDTVKPELSEVTVVTTPTSNKTPEYVFSTTKPGTVTYDVGCNGSLASVSVAGNATTTFASLADGVYNCTITLTDAAGNSTALNISQFQIDTIAPVVDAGGDKYVNAEATQDAMVTDTDGSGVATYAWTNETPEVGTVTFGSSSAEDTTISASADGVYTLKLTATDNAGNVGSGTMKFTWDKTAPSITAPADITTEATAHLTPLTLTPATAIDNIDLHPVITSNAPASFAVGTTTVTWTATDAAGNSSTATQKVTITDTKPPAIDTHADMTVEATSADGATVTYDPPAATDIVDGTSDTVTCAPESGSTFPIGYTTVNCNAKDNAGNSAAQTSFVVHVVDTTKPVIAAHDSIIATADQLGGKKVTYDAPIASDAVDGDQSAICTPASGTLFPVNETTTVTCTKTDAHGNIAEPTAFTVTVNPDALSQIGISASPTSLTTADTSTITVAGQDQFGNTIVTNNSTKVVLSTDGSGSLASTILTLAGGVAQTTLSSSSAGVVHVNAASGILDPNAVAVTFSGATVPDTTAPVITNVQSTNIGTNSATITWTTNENSSSQIEYGTTSSYGTSNTVDSSLTAAHSMTLTGLAPNTTYHFRVKSSDAAGNLATSVDNTFTTIVDDSTAVLKVTGIDAVNTYAATGGTFDNGFKWTFHVTVPTTETKFAMKFSDFTNGSGGTIPAANNIRFYSAQSSDAASPTSAKAITAAGAYSNPITLSADNDPLTAGRQIDVTVEMQVPAGTPGGSYSASYGLQSTAGLPQ